ncbi:zinc dependent phospholipase C family protein [Alkalihalobacillus sp. AL-G]|uniref:zinc dependent phospholipase C family protein n=1 Tax=Alkalihalobacillus sp. AL-G TaxID=2926399 RepID=UPI002729CF8E|nr:zinc dependent phospholipase C family protein [Alkalihalobacillus sp. AL-G]WLD94034.1 zinc dependent phospholipase C family protein [Alkalihalobacillus sp. AL-G]
MPNVWTHIHFGETVIEKTGLLRLDHETGPYFRFGTQGPDPFFYHNFWPWKSTPVAEVGDRIHHEHCGQFLMKLVQFTKMRLDDRKLIAFTTGFITHHILDRNAHPYIIYRSGNENNRHQKLEILIDTLLMKELRGIETWNTPVYKQLYIGGSLQTSVKEMLSEAIDAYFHDLHKQLPSNYIERSYEQMQQALKVLYDPLGWKYKLLKDRIEPFSYQKDIESGDFLNETKTRWIHPAQPDEHSEQTFYDLLDQAERECADILQELGAYWFENSEDAFDRLEQKIGNISYDSGKDCTLPLENRHFEPML